MTAIPETTEVSSRLVNLKQTCSQIAIEQGDDESDDKTIAIYDEGSLLKELDDIVRINQGC